MYVFGGVEDEEDEVEDFKFKLSLPSNESVESDIALLREDSRTLS